jgi:hypothetical protein
MYNSETNWAQNLFAICFCCNMQFFTRGFHKQISISQNKMCHAKHCKNIHLNYSKRDPTNVPLNKRNIFSVISSPWKLLYAQWNTFKTTVLEFFQFIPKYNHKVTSSVIYMLCVWRRCFQTLTDRVMGLSVFKKELTFDLSIIFVMPSLHSFFIEQYASMWSNRSSIFKSHLRQYQYKYRYKNSAWTRHWVFHVKSFLQTYIFEPPLLLKKVPSLFKHVLLLNFQCLITTVRNVEM